MDGSREDYVKWKQQGSERQMLYIFPHMYKLDPNTNIIICAFTQNMFPKVGQLEEIKQGGKEQNNEIRSCICSCLYS
jgi:hypothetical protein